MYLFIFSLIKFFLFFVLFFISATCRRPIRGAAGRPLKPSEYWLDESRVKTDVHTEYNLYSESLSRPSFTVSPNAAPVRRSFLPLLLKLLLLVVVCASLFFVYQNLDAEQISTLKGLSDSVVVPVQSAVDKVATYLGISGSSVAEGNPK